MPPDAAGIDLHSEFQFVAVPSGRAAEPVRRFGAFTEDLERLADGLQTCGVRSVALESTGVYGIPWFELWERRGFQVILVDPRKLKSVPGRKSDVQDCPWLQQWHTFGLLAAAFRPDEPICVLRASLRQRALLVEQGAQHIQHLQKSLTQRNLQRDRVLSDITGVTGMRIIDAIRNGERHPLTRARLRDERCRHDEATLAKALVGTWRVEHLFTLKPSRALYRTMPRLIAECDAQLEAHLPSLADRPAPTTGPDLPPARKKPHRKGRVAFDAQPLLAHQAGVDLTRIDGIDTNTALTVLGEIGLDMSRWPTEKHFASWLALCLPSCEDSPDNRESAGRRQSGRTRPSSNRAATALRRAAQGRHRSPTALGAYLRRRKAALGAPQAITATARKLALLIYRALQHGLQYVDPGQDWYERQDQDRLLKSRTRKALQLGYQLTPTPPTPT